MATISAIVFGFVVIGMILIAVLGAVERREKFAFGTGIVLLVVGPILVGELALSAVVGGVVAFVGVLAIIASTVPLLHQSPTTT